MTDVVLLKQKIKDSGITVVALARKSGIVRETLYNRMQQDSDFKASEIEAISNVLNLTRDEVYKIFFKKGHEFNSHQV